MKEIMNYPKREILHSLSVIESDSELSVLLREKYGTDFNMIRACIKGDLIKPEAINLILQLAPICYKIGDKVFLKGETKGNYDLIGDAMDFAPLTELYDMTTEMETGDSYTFYVSTTDYFDLANPSEMIAVKRFLDSLK